jgi:hypothetical protein
LRQKLISSINGLSFDTTIKMSSLLFIAELFSLLVTRLTIFVTVLILNIIILSFIFCSGSQSLLGTNIQSDSTSLFPQDYFEFKEKTYKIPFTDLQLTLPSGWKGINLSSSILISPDSLDIKTGENKEHTPVFMMIGYFNLDSVLKTYHAATLEQYVQNMAKTTNCTIVHQGPIRVNGLDGYKIRLNCESVNGEVDNIYDYFFISNSKVIFIGLKGINPHFYRNIENFEESVNTIRAIDSRSD